MIDLSLTKIALIGVVALVVIGPEKLPKVARMAGALLGRAQRYINDVKSEVSRDMALDELHNLKREVQEAAHDIESSLSPQPAEAASAEINQHTRAPDHSTSKAINFRRQKMNRSALLTQKRHKSRAGLRTGASRYASSTSGRNPSGFFS